MFRWNVVGRPGEKGGEDECLLKFHVKGRRLLRLRRIERANEPNRETELVSHAV